MKNMYGETVKPQYEVALKQHVKGDVDNDYETVDFIGAYSYKKACEIAKAAMVGQLASPIVEGIDPNPSMQDVCIWSVKFADALIEELKKV